MSAAAKKAGGETRHRFRHEHTVLVDEGLQPRHERSVERPRHVTIGVCRRLPPVVQDEPRFIVNRAIDLQPMKAVDATDFWCHLKTEV